MNDNNSTNNKNQEKKGSKPKIIGNTTVPKERPIVVIGKILRPNPPAPVPEERSVLEERSRVRDKKDQSGKKGGKKSSKGKPGPLCSKKGMEPASSEESVVLLSDETVASDSDKGVRSRSPIKMVKQEEEGTEAVTIRKVRDMLPGISQRLREFMEQREMREARKRDEEGGTRAEENSENNTCRRRSESQDSHCSDISMKSDSGVGDNLPKVPKGQKRGRPPSSGLYVGVGAARKDLQRAKLRKIEDDKRMEQIEKEERDKEFRIQQGLPPPLLLL